MVHEQERFDRNAYVEINQTNIIDEYKYTFELCKECMVTSQSAFVFYDKCSVMHYNAFAFCKDCRIPVILSLAKQYCVMGQRDKLTESDIQKIKATYSALAVQ
jgi:hypothetical protein